jgi:RNA polymerase sigma-70 factor (ECF subfamily)
MGEQRAEVTSVDVALTRRAAKGERAAQAVIAQRVLPRVRKVARSLAASTADADDAAQHALLEVLRSCHSFRGDASLERWAARIATRAALRHLQRERKRSTASDAVVEDTADHRMASSGLAEQLPRGLQAYLRELPEAQRTALVLHHALGYSLDEVAELTDVSPNTVKGRLRLGMGTLRKLVRREQRIGAPAGHATLQEVAR